MVQVFNVLFPIRKLVHVYNSSGDWNYTMIAECLGSNWTHQCSNQGWLPAAHQSLCESYNPSMCLSIHPEQIHLDTDLPTHPFIH